MTLLAPRICCLDLDTFFVSVKRLLDPRLAGKSTVLDFHESLRRAVDGARTRYGYDAVRIAGAARERE